MQQRSLTAYLYLAIGIIVLFAWGPVVNMIWPPPPKPEAPAPELPLTELDGRILVAGGLGSFEPEPIIPPTQEGVAWLGGGISSATVGKDLAREGFIVGVRQPGQLLPMGYGEQPAHLQVLLNTRGGSIQQIKFTHFQQATREGLPDKDANGQPRQLMIIPGYPAQQGGPILDKKEPPVVFEPGECPAEFDVVSNLSYLMTHYRDPRDDRPVDTLSRRIWTVEKNETTSEGQTISFATELQQPYYIKIVKEYSLKKNEYHVGFRLKIEPLAAPEGKRKPFRYQISGPRNMPIEGEWYSATYRQGIVGWVDDDESARRLLEDARQVRRLAGSDRHTSKADEPIRYMGVMVQYFASILALDDIQPEGQKANYIEHVRFTPEGKIHRDKTTDHTMLDDLTSRAISRELDVSKPIDHPYLIYTGPTKVRLLKQLEGEKAVPEDTVHRYRDHLYLNTLTDAPMDNWIGRFASFIYWSDLVIVFTNVIHSLLGLFSHAIPNLGICIMLITLLVRGSLFPFSRKQQIKAKIMQAKQAKLAPQMKVLTEKYGNDFQKLNAEKMKLFREHGINPAAAMGGCFLLLAQMPVFMGLYYALQESVFLRLENFVWVKNLAAPDMLFSWGEKIPFLSTPADFGGMLYLGPFFNLLPLIAVGLMLYTQSKMMPKSEDPQVQMQQKMMKIMMIFFLFFFYKVAAGLCIYFIFSSVWGIIERQLLPKNITEDYEQKMKKPNKPRGWLGRKLDAWKKRMEEIMEEAQKQQQLRSQNGPNKSTTDKNQKRKKR
ncbi:MAG: membrane protein insertase YidC [Zavarzinella sp.]